jgi:hypothetical protein
VTLKASYEGFALQSRFCTLFINENLSNSYIAKYSLMNYFTNDENFLINLKQTDFDLYLFVHFLVK